MCINVIGDHSLDTSEGGHASVRVPTPPGKSWIFFLENSRTWKVLENHFGPGKSWKKIMEVLHFSSGSNGKQSAIVEHPVCVGYCLLKYSVECR